MIPLIITLLLFTPVQEEFITKGDIEPVTELGVEGSVYFTYVHSGFVENYLDKISLGIQYNNIEFIPLSDEEYEYYTSEYTEDDQYYKEQTIANAVNVTSDSESEPKHRDRIADIIYEAREYYGDSFGLMIAIGLIEEELSMDYSRNGSFLISGTGTIEADHTVGSVGAIRHKLLTAEENGVDIFFMPKDEIYYGETSNQREAINVLEKEDLDLDVVFVSTLEEALNVLEDLN